MTELKQLVSEELCLPVEAQVSAMAEAIAARHGAASQAVLFYGSCLRLKQLQGLMLDFYLIVSDYPSAYDKRWLAAANRLIPPNVFYFEHDGLVSKYAVLSEADFDHECSPEAWTVSTAARFAQPTRLVWSTDEAAAGRMIQIVSHAATTLLGWTRPLAPEASVEELWKLAFRQTFHAELRAERLSRPDALVEADPDRYERFGAAALQQAKGSMTREQARRWWRRKQAHGKRYSIARLVKASATFAGGADYIVWKINRHTGAGIVLKPWQRKHPLLAAITLAPRLLRSGAVR